MWTRFAALLAGLMVLVTAAPACAGALSLYGRLPTVEDIALSPDGKHIAMISTNGEERRIGVIDLDTRKTLVALDAGPTKVRSVIWADNENVIYTVSRTTRISGIIAPRADYSNSVVFNITTRKQRPLIGEVNQPSMTIVLGGPAIRVVDGKTIAFTKGVAFADDGQGVVSVFRNEIASGRTQIIKTGDAYSEDYLISADGQVVAESGTNDRNGESVLRLRGERGGLRAAKIPEEVDRGLSIRGFTRDGQAMVVSYGVKTDTVWAETPFNGDAWRPMTDLGENDGLFFDRYTEKLIGYRTLKGDVATLTFYDPQMQKIWNGTEKAFPGQRVHLVEYSRDFKRLIVLADSPKDGETYYFIDIATGQASSLSDLYSGLKPADISPVRPVSYKAADGTPISGYLTLPAGAAASPKNLPLIVLPHGGPASRDTPGFDWWSQALASRGYAVLQPNFRGSSGFGRAFLEAGFGEWGRKMQTDLSDGVRYLAGEGTIDPKRVCIVGASYGGYAALAGATIDRDVYRCAASVAGPADLRRMLVTSRLDSGQGSFQYWKRFMGVDGTRDPDLGAISPASHADLVTIPVLLVHGKDDTVVDYEQSKLMADALKKAGKDVEFVTLDGEDHWLSRGATRLKMLESVVAFVEKNNPPK